MWHEVTTLSVIEYQQLILYKPTKIKIENIDVCIVKTEEGLIGIYNKCPHAGAQLHFGHCNKKGIISCPLHGYKFNLKNGLSADGNNYKLNYFKFKIENNKICYEKR